MMPTDIILRNGTSITIQPYGAFPWIKIAHLWKRYMDVQVLDEIIEHLHTIIENPNLYTKETPYLNIDYSCFPTSLRIPKDLNTHAIIEFNDGRFNSIHNYCSYVVWDHDEFYLLDHAMCSCSLIHIHDLQNLIYALTFIKRVNYRKI